MTYNIVYDYPVKKELVNAVKNAIYAFADLPCFKGHQTVVINQYYLENRTENPITDDYLEEKHETFPATPKNKITINLTNDFLADNRWAAGFNFRIKTIIAEKYVSHIEDVIFFSLPTVFRNWDCFHKEFGKQSDVKQSRTLRRVLKVFSSISNFLFEEKCKYAENLMLHELIHSHPMFTEKKYHCKNKKCLMFANSDFGKVKDLCPDCIKKLSAYSKDDIRKQIMQNICKEKIYQRKKSKDAYMQFYSHLFGRKL